MSKKRYTLYISRPLARRFDEVSLKSHGGKSALVEEALTVSLRPPEVPTAADQMIGRLDDLARAAKTVERDVAIVTESLALFVRYFLTITPPLPLDEQEPARLLGHERFQVFVAQVGKQLAGDQRLVSEVLETIVVQKPDLFAVAGVDAPPKPRTAIIEQFVPRPNGRAEDGGANHD